MTPQTGDIFLHKGEGAFSAAIMAYPGADYSHVSMFIEHPIYGPALFESTSLGNVPDVITGKLLRGVQLTPFESRIAAYKGEIHHRSIIGVRHPEQIKKSVEFVDKWHGTPYPSGIKGARELSNAQRDVFSWTENKPDTSTLFCSETGVMYLRDIEMIVDDGVTPNESTPTDLSMGGPLVLMPGYFFAETYRVK